MTYLDSDVFRSMFAASPAAICVVSGDSFKIRWANHAYRVVLEPPWNTAGLIGHGLEDVLPCFKNSPTESIFREVANTRGTYHNPEYEFIGFRRGLTYWDWTLVALPSDSGVPDLMIQAIEISDQVKARKAATEQNQLMLKNRRLYETILDNTPDLVYVFDLEHRFVYANKVLLQMWGKTWDEAIGKNCLELGYEPWHAEMHGRELEQVKVTKKPIRGEVPFNGTFGLRIYDYIFVPVLGPSGEVEAIAGTTRDVTERKQVEEGLLAARADLEEKVMQRTHELMETNQQLLQAKAQAELASRAKSDILSNTSHELRTPLNSILLFSQMLREDWDGNLTDQQKKFAFNIQEAGEELLALVNDLLDLAQIESGIPLPLEMGAVDWHHLAQTLRTSFDELANKKKLSFSVNFADNLPTNFQADERRLQQILKNLLSNAFKFTHKGHVSLETSLSDGSRQDGENPALEFRVSDSGIGIEKSKLQLIFEAFQQGELGTTRQYGGTGLGLSISRELAQRMGGNLAVESEAGKGSVFVLRLPLPQSQLSTI